MELDPETIAAIFAILWPKIQECLAKGQTQGRIVKRLRNASRGDRAKLLEALPKRERRQLRGYWKVKKRRRISKRLAKTIVRNARKAA